MHDQPPLLAPHRGPAPDPTRRSRILKRLDQFGPGPKANYETLCALLDSHADLPSASMLIHHMIRELESALREVLREEPSRTDKKSKQKGESGHSAEIDAIAAALGLQSEVVEAWYILVGRQHEWAHRRDLEQPALVDHEVLERVARLEWVFDRVLEAFADRYGIVHQRLRTLAALAQPTVKDAQRLRKEFPQDAVTQAEFYRLAGPQWLDPLDGAELFTMPPPALDAGDGYVSFPLWPAMTYLLRMADLVRQSSAKAVDEKLAAANSAVRAKIVEVACRIPKTDNPRVGADLAAIGRSVEPEHAARLVPRLVSALPPAT